MNTTQTEMITQEMLLREAFESERFSTHTLDDFMMYFAQILRFGMKLDLIMEEQCTAISSLIFMAAESLVVTDEDTLESAQRLAISNYLYVINMYVSSLSPWEAWLALKDISNIEMAKDLARKAKVYVMQHCHQARGELVAIKEKVTTVNVRNITNYYQNQLAFIHRLMGFDSVYQHLDLREYHKMYLDFGRYLFLHDIENFGKDLCERLLIYVRSFCMEISIMSAVNARQILSYRKAEKEAVRAEKEQAIEQINLFYEGRLNSLREEYARRTHEFILSMHRPGRKKHDYRDEVDIEDEYTRLKYQLETEWNQKLDVAKKEYTRANFGLTEVDVAYFSLVDFIKEYAIYASAMKGESMYPETTLERSKVLFHLNVSEAIAIFVEEHKELLTNEQTAYLLMGA